MAKVRLQVTVDKEIIKWVNSKIKVKDYSSKSHAIEKALMKLKQSNP